jgi:hypothetical protein
MSIQDAIDILFGTKTGDKDEAKKALENYVLKSTEELEDAQKRVNQQYKKSSELSKSILGTWEDTNNVLKYVSNQQYSVLLDSVAWLKNTKEQYLYAEGIAKTYKKLGRDMGLGAAQSKALSDSFKESLPAFAKLGLDADDLSSTLKSIAESSGRFKGFFPEKDTKKMAQMIAGLGMSSEAVGELTDRFDLMGVSVDRMYEGITEVYGDAQALGLNAKKVTDVLERNFASMQRMSFKGGVKAMTEMAKLAVDMRMDVADMLGMADKFYNPEAAIEAAAELQLMGGDIAKAFGDPFEVMYMARNKPEELAKKLEEMTQNMTVFNEETGEYTLPAEARQQLTFMADKLGLSKDNVIDMAYQTSKLKDIKSAFDGTSMFSEEEQSAIASMAKFNTSTGKWQVDFGGEKIDIDDSGALRSAVEDGMLTTQPDEDPIKQTAHATLTTSEIAKNTLEEIKAQTIATVDLYETLEAGLVKPQNELTVLLTDLVSNTGDLLKDEDVVGTAIADFMKNPEVKAKELGDEIATQINYLNDNINALFTGDETLLSLLTTQFGLLNKNLTSIAKGGTSIPTPDGIMTPGGNSLVRMPKGTMSAVIEPDVNDYAFFIQKDKVTKGGDKTTTTNNNTNQTTNQNVNFNATIKLESNNPSLDLTGMEDTISKTIHNMFLNGKGSIDGNNKSKSNRTMVGGGSL